MDSSVGQSLSILRGLLQFCPSTGGNRDHFVEADFPLLIARCPSGLLPDCRPCGRINTSLKETSRRRRDCFRCYICRVEKGHTVPAIETLEKMARALEVPMCQLFYDGEEPPNCRIFPSGSPPRLTAAGARDNRGRSTDVR